MMKTGRYCPMRRGKCVETCAWRMHDMCAMVQLAGQARRQGDELYAMVEIMREGSEAIAPDMPTGEADADGVRDGL